MDPIAHTLVGAAMAEAGLKRLSRYGTVTLLIGANLPDIDIVAGFWGEDASLYFRRGWSHGILALVVLPLLLAGTVWLWHRWRGGGGGGRLSFRPDNVVMLSFLAVLSHPLLDWLNTYGVRLLMPFDQRWFYGDTLFIVDPWLWILTAAGVVMARSGNFGALAGWIFLAALATVLILSTGYATPEIKLAWVAAVGMIVAFRWCNRTRKLGAPIARAGLAALIVYICIVYGAARFAESMAAERFAASLEVQSNPVPGIPFSHRVVLVHENFYRVIAPNGEVYQVPREQPNAIVRAALATESIRGFVNWMRFPYWKVEETADGWLVSIWDLRYQGPSLPEAGIGFAQVKVPKSQTLLP